MRRMDSPSVAPLTHKDAANDTVLPRLNTGDPGGIRTPDTQFRRLVL